MNELKVFCSDCKKELVPVAEDYERAEEDGIGELWLICDDCHNKPEDEP